MSAKKKAALPLAQQFARQIIRTQESLRRATTDLEVAIAIYVQIARDARERSSKPPRPRSKKAKRRAR